MKWYYNLLWSEDATSAVEYAVMLALILVVAIGAISSFGSEQGGLWGNVGSQLEVMSN
jgi:Flp pilus assembly pilin Flp